MSKPVSETGPWRWRCPHCLGGNMSLASADKHLRRKHSDCWSCKTERLLVHALQEGRGFIMALKPDPHGFP